MDSFELGRDRLTLVAGWGTHGGKGKAGVRHHQKVPGEVQARNHGGLGQACDSGIGKKQVLEVLGRWADRICRWFGCEVSESRRRLGWPLGEWWCWTEIRESRGGEKSSTWCWTCYIRRANSMGRHWQMAGYRSVDCRQRSGSETQV